MNKRAVLTPVFFILLLIPSKTHTMEATTAEPVVTIRQRLDRCLAAVVPDVERLVKEDDVPKAAAAAAASDQRSTAVTVEGQGSTALETLKRKRVPAITELRNIAAAVEGASSASTDDLAAAYEGLAWARALRDLPIGKEHGVLPKQTVITALRRRIRASLAGKRVDPELRHITDDFSDDEVTSGNVVEEVVEDYERGKIRKKAIVAIKAELAKYKAETEAIENTKKGLFAEIQNNTRSFEEEQRRLIAQARQGLQEGDALPDVQQVLLDGELQSKKVLMESKNKALEIRSAACDKDSDVLTIKEETLRRTVTLQNLKIWLRREQLRRVAEQLPEKRATKERAIAAAEAELAQAQTEYQTCHNSERLAVLKKTIADKQTALAAQRQELASIKTLQGGALAERIASINHERSWTRQLLKTTGIIS